MTERSDGGPGPRPDEGVFLAAMRAEIERRWAEMVAAVPDEEFYGLAVYDCSENGYMEVVGFTEEGFERACTAAPPLGDLDRRSAMRWELWEEPYWVQGRGCELGLVPVRELDDLISDIDEDTLERWMAEYRQRVRALSARALAEAAAAGLFGERGRNMVLVVLDENKEGERESADAINPPELAARFHADSDRYESYMKAYEAYWRNS